MRLELRKCLFAIAVSLLVSGSGVLPHTEATANTKSDSKASAATTNGTVAMVNGTAIPQEQFTNAMNYQLEISAMNGVTITESQLPALKYQILESLINNELLYQESQKSGIIVTETEINDAYETRKQKAQFETDAEFEEALKQTNKSIASYRTEIAQGLTIDRFIENNFYDKTDISDSDAKNYYDSNPAYFQEPARVKVSHIMIRLASDADQAQKDAAVQKIEQAMKRLKAGEAFAAVAGEVSEDTSSKDNGGNLGYLSKGQTPQSFEEAAFGLQKDETSGIVQTEAGYHILNVTDKTDARTLSFEEAKSDIISSLKSSTVNSAVSSYLKILKNRSTIVTYPISN